MTTDLCAEDVVVHIACPQIISSESIVPVAAAPRVAVAGGTPAGGVELGRRLLLAARAGDTAAVLDLMAKGAPFTTDWLGTSPLHLAAANDHADTCAVLLRAGVSRDSRTKVERTPLHLAATAGHEAVVTLLLEHGAAVDCRDMLQMTPLHWAAARGRLEAARALLRHGASTRARCKFRKTPRCLALRADRADLAALLQAAEESSLTDRMIEESPKNQQEFKNVQRVHEIKTQPKVKIQPEKKIVIESKTEPVPTSAAGGAAALLRAHGITLLPADRGCTVLSALRSGRTVVLSDAGKLMLKESSNTDVNEAQIITNITNTATNVASANIIQVDATGADLSVCASPSVQNVDLSADVVQSVNSVNIVDSAGRRGMRARARCGARGVKVLTLNKNQPLKRVIHPSDLQQVKVVRVPAASGAGAGSPARLRPALKIVLDKAHLHRLLATARPDAETTLTTAQSTSSVESSSAMDVQETEGAEAAAEGADGSLRSQLTAARAALASLGAELRACRARLAHYEGDQL